MKPSESSTLLKIQGSPDIWSGLQLSLGLFGFLFYAFHKLPSGLLLDETATAWIIRDGILSTLFRSLHYQGQSPLYYCMIAFWTNLFGKSELALRSFSFAAFLLSIVGLYFIHRRRISLELSSCGTIISGTFLLLYVPILDARPYGFASASLISSYYFYLVWIDTGSPKARIMNIVCLIVTIYFNWIYSTVLIVQTLLIYNFGASRRKLFIRQWMVNLIIICILCSPNGYQVLLIFKKRFIYNYLVEPTFYDWAVFTFPILGIILSILPGLFIMVFWPKVIFLTKTKTLLFLGLSWMLIPSAILFLISINSVPILSEKYSGHIGGIGLVIASLIACISVSFTRRIASLYAIIMAVIYVVLAAQQGFESWKEPIADLESLERIDARPVVLSTGLVESNSKEWITDPVKREYLSAPMQYYFPSLKFILAPTGRDLALLEYTLVDKMGELQKKGFYLVVRRKIWLSRNGTRNISTNTFKKYFIRKGFLVKYEKDYSAIVLIEFDPMEFRKH